MCCSVILSEYRNIPAPVVCLFNSGFKMKKINEITLLKMLALLSVLFFHCYRPVEILKSRGMYSFVARSPLLRLVGDTPDSNRDWKSRYFFMDGDKWMGSPGETEFMPVDTTWGVLSPSGMPSLMFLFFLLRTSLVSNRPLLQSRTVHKFLSNSGVFWSRFSNKAS